MGKTYVLDRVAADLAHGFTHPAIQRLSSLVAAYPHDLDLRRRLAAVHRRVGNRIQAGRWDYLTIGADSQDTRAFERAFPSAGARLREVRWPHRAGQAATAYARNRLAKLMAAAEAERPGTVRPEVAGSAAGSASATQPGSAARRARAHRSRTSGAGVSPMSHDRVTTGRSWWSGRGDATVEALARKLPQLRSSGRSRKVSAIHLAVAAVAAAPLVVVGIITVIEWIVQ